MHHSEPIIDSNSNLNIKDLRFNSSMKKRSFMTHASYTLFISINASFLVIKNKLSFLQNSKLRKERGWSQQNSCVKVEPLDVHVSILTSINLYLAIIEHLLSVISGYLQLYVE